MLEFLRQLLTVGRHQFAKPPVRSYYLWAEIAVLMFVGSWVTFLIAFYGLSLSGQEIIIASLPVVMLTVLWLGILRVHKDVREACQSQLNSQKNTSEKDDPHIGMLLDKLAFLSSAGFYYAAAAVIGAYYALVPVALHTRR